MNNIEQIKTAGKTARMRKNMLDTVVYIMLTVWALLVLFPFYWMLLTSVKSYGTYNSEYIPKFLS